MQNIFRCILLLSLILASCSSNKQAPETRKDAGIPSVSPEVSGALALEILPKTPSRNSAVDLLITGFDARSAKIEWLLNGAVQESSNPVHFILSDARKGDVLQARAVVNGKEILSPKVEIVNALPEISSAGISLDNLKQNQIMRADVTANDPDGDSVSFQYEWTINGKPSGAREYLDQQVKRGDKVSVRATPCDAEGCGHDVVLNREVLNQPPVIEANREFNFDGKTYLYQVKAVDPDGDALNYSLEEAPAGMTIDKSSGLLTWTVPSDFTGQMSPVVVVNDGNGGIARYPLKITIRTATDSNSK